MEYTNKPDDFQIYIENQNKNINNKENQIKIKETKKKEEDKKYQKKVLI